MIWPDASWFDCFFRNNPLITKIELEREDIKVYFKHHSEAMSMQSLRTDNPLRWDLESIKDLM
jgi:hypothetical protein